MSTKYKFLILEDEENDAELIMHQIKTAGIVCDFKCTDNEIDFKRLIDEFKPDLVLSDYSLPTYDGMSALTYVLDHSPDLPVIIITGSINEETAVSCMKAGAVDYILKDKMNRLGLAVIAALENKKVKIEKHMIRLKLHEEVIERRRNEAALRESEERYRSLTQTANDGIIAINSWGDIVSWNMGAEEIFGYKEAEVLNQPITLCMPERYREAHVKGIKRQLSTGESHIFGTMIELHGLKKNGDEFPMDCSISSWKTDRGKYFTGIIRDISARIKADEEMRKLSHAVEQSPSAVMITDIKGNVEYVNPRFTQMSGYSATEVIGKQPDILSSDEFSPDGSREMWETITAGKEWRGEFQKKKRPASSTGCLPPFLQ